MIKKYLALFCIVIVFSGCMVAASPVVVRTYTGDDDRSKEVK